MSATQGCENQRAFTEPFLGSENDKASISTTHADRMPSGKAARLRRILPSVFDDLLVRLYVDDTERATQATTQIVLMRAMGRQRAKCGFEGSTLVCGTGSARHSLRSDAGHKHCWKLWSVPAFETVQPARDVQA